MYSWNITWHNMAGSLVKWAQIKFPSIGNEYLKMGFFSVLNGPDSKLHLIFFYQCVHCAA